VVVLDLRVRVRVEAAGEEITTHLMEDVQIREVIDAESKAPLPAVPRLALSERDGVWFLQ
jgi:hypothetical protein